MISINLIIAGIRADANQKIINKIWERVAQINSALDDACGSALGGHYGSALNCAAEAVDSYMELVALCKETSEQPLREHLRDALGSVNWEKFELPADMMSAIEKARNEAANPGFQAKITRNPVNFTSYNITIDQYKGEISDEERRFTRRDYDGFEEWENRLIGKVELPEKNN